VGRSSLGSPLSMYQDSVDCDALLAVGQGLFRLLAVVSPTFAEYCILLALTVPLVVNCGSLACDALLVLSKRSFTLLGLMSLVLP